MEPLTFTSEGAKDTLHRLRLQKGDGTTYLMLWQDIPESGKDVALQIVKLSISDMVIKNVGSFQPTSNRLGELTSEAKESSPLQLVLKSPS